MSSQRGAAVVEFALVSILVMFLTLGLVDMGRVLFFWNSAVHATNTGARAAAIAAVGDTDKVVAAMRPMMPAEFDASWVKVEYSTDGITFATGMPCVRGTCRFVRVSVDVSGNYGLNLAVVPFLQLVMGASNEATASILLPPFSTTIPVEALGAT